MRDPIDILTLIEEAETYILKNIRIGMRLDGLIRVDVPEIDRMAFREAIINAFCHRDYRDPDEVRIAIFPDRVESPQREILTDRRDLHNRVPQADCGRRRGTTARVRDSVGLGMADAIRRHAPTNQNLDPVEKPA